MLLCEEVTFSSSETGWIHAVHQMYHRDGHLHPNHVPGPGERVPHLSQHCVPGWFPSLTISTLKLQTNKHILPMLFFFLSVKFVRIPRVALKYTTRVRQDTLKEGRSRGALPATTSGCMKYLVCVCVCVHWWFTFKWQFISNIYIVSHCVKIRNLKRIRNQHMTQIQTWFKWKRTQSRQTCRSQFYWFSFNLKRLSWYFTNSGI